MPGIKSKLKTKIIDNGYNDAMDAIKKAKRKPYVEVGVLQKDAKKKNPGDTFTLGQIASVNEFGTIDGRIPSRSYIRSTMDEKRRRHNAVGDIVIVKILSGVLTLKQGLDLIGEEIVSNIKDKITKLRTPKNAASTIAKKGSTNPLIDTGRLRSSINKSSVIK